MEDHTIDLNATKFQGVKNNFNISFSAAEDVYVDAWQFAELVPDGIEEIEAGKIANSTSANCYDLSGRKLSGSHQNRGIVIEQFVDENGVKHNRLKY